MSEISYPLQSKCCYETHYGPVCYCPYCGVPTKPVTDGNPFTKASNDQKHAEHTLSEDNRQHLSGNLQKENQDQDGLNGKNSQEDIPIIEIQNNQEGFVLHEKPDEPLNHLNLNVDEAKKEIERFKPEPTFDKTKPGKRMIIIPIVVTIIGIIAYISFFDKESQGPDTNMTSMELLISDTLEKGVQLSVAINRLSKEENIVNAATRLLKISPTNPTYIKQLNDAKGKLKELTDNKNKIFSLYIENIKQFEKNTQKDLFSSIETIKSKGLSDRENLVIELIIKHINSLIKKEKFNQDLWLSDFTRVSDKND